MQAEEAEESGHGFGSDDVGGVNRLHPEEVCTCNDAPDRDAYSKNPEFPAIAPANCSVM
jgi:hypothetical protein